MFTINPPDGKTPIKVLVVDDSAFMRYTITQRLALSPEIQVVGTARDGQEALEVIPKLNPDVVTLDVEMPRLDGLSTLREIMADHPRPVIMLSSLTSQGAVETVQALTLGAVDFIAKPSNKANIGAVMDEVVGKIIRAARARVWVVPRNRNVEPAQLPKGGKTIRKLTAQDRVLVIGSSTGGPRALSTVVPSLPANLQAAVLIVQHMPAGFTRSLAERLDSLSALKIKEAEPGDKLEVGRALVAPGGFHMILDANGEIALNQNPPVHAVRPAIDVTMTSVVQRYGRVTVGVVLTGMGNDGTTGCTLIHSAGGKVIAEAESTCVVYGMPRSVYEAGVVDLVVPLTEVAATIQRVING
jgi:two-component system, chemotaxis family, protein-glutamate methylesterase/glutaminase